MAPTFSPSRDDAGVAPTALSDQNRQILCSIARRSIEQGTKTGHPLIVDPEDGDGPLRAQGSSFVTLFLQQSLRGCMGALEAERPLIQDVAYTSFSAAFRDPRFTPVSVAELVKLEIKISVLSPPETMVFTSEADLIAQIRPGLDGLILIEEKHRGTLLPSVWESIPDPKEFLHHLKLKAFLPP